MLLALKFIVITLIDICFNCKSSRLASSIILREKLFFLKERQSHLYMYIKDIHGLLICVKTIIAVGTFFLTSCQHEEWFPLSQVF